MSLRHQSPTSGARFVSSRPKPLRNREQHNPNREVPRRSQRRNAQRATNRPVKLSATARFHCKEIHVLFQVQPHLAHHPTPLPLRLANLLHNHTVLIAKPQPIPHLATLVAERRPHGVVQLALWQQELSRVRVGVEAADETRPVGLHENAGGCGAVAPDTGQLADVAGGADVPAVLEGGVGVVLGVGRRHVEVGARVADVAVHVGGEVAPARVRERVDVGFPGGAQAGPVGGGELVEDELAREVVVGDCVGGEVDAVVCGVAEDGGDFDVAVVFELFVGVVLDEVVVEGGVPEVDGCVFAAGEGGFDAASYGFLEGYGVEGAEAGEVCAA